MGSTETTIKKVTKKVFHVTRIQYRDACDSLFSLFSRASIVTQTQTAHDEPGLRPPFQYDPIFSRSHKLQV